MMWFSSLLLLVAFSGVLCQFQYRVQQCLAGIENFDFERFETQSVEERLEAACHEFLGTYRCLDRIFLFEFQSSMEEVSDLIGESEEYGRVLRVMVNTNSMMTDLCGSGKQLNEDFKADIACFETIDADEAIVTCQEKGFDNFTKSSFGADKTCKTWAFVAACASQIVHESCGDRAFNTINTMLKRTTIFPKVLCSRGKLEEMKTTLVDRLNMSEEEKEIFKMALDLKRRRK